MLNNKPCFCGSNKIFSNCCQVFIEQNALKLTFPQTPEQLMRSRFSAYVIGNSQYIYDTYAKKSQEAQSVKEINDWGESCAWIALKIHFSTDINKIENSTSEQFVEFSVFYVTDNTLCELREKSRFILEGTPSIQMALNNKIKEEPNVQWRYIDGDIIEHCELTKIKRKDLCPCNNYPSAWSVKKNKKFKQCCAN
jgi:SEC-C motif-containing protein